jgi:uncharacterized protein YndB with AHSA1/START domain
VSSYRYSTWIDAAPNVVWDVFTDLDRIPEWQTGRPVVSDASGRGDVPGTTYTVRRGPATSRTRVLEASRPTRYLSRTDAYFGLRFEMTATIIPAKSGTILEIQADTHWPRGMRLPGRLVEAAVLSGHEADRELERLKLLVERGPR